MRSLALLTSSALVEEVGRRAGVALDNARLYREVAQARDQLDIILQGVADGIIVYDTHSQIIYANEAAAQMTGYTSIQDMLQTPPLQRKKPIQDLALVCISPVRSSSDIMVG
jgi:PAS domain-containing protein